MRHKRKSKGKPKNSWPRLDLPMESFGRSLGSGRAAVYPFAFGIVVRPGPTFENEGLLGKIGVTQRGSRDDMWDWACTCLSAGWSEGGDTDGGWSPFRSACVSWGQQDKVYFHKCSGDSGGVDLSSPVLVHSQMTLISLPIVLKQLNLFLKMSYKAAFAFDLPLVAVDRMLVREYAKAPRILRFRFRQIGFTEEELEKLVKDNQVHYAKDAWAKGKAMHYQRWKMRFERAEKKRTQHDQQSLNKYFRKVSHNQYLKL